MRITPNTVLIAACLLPAALLVWRFWPHQRGNEDPANVNQIIEPSATNASTLPFHTGPSDAHNSKLVAAHDPRRPVEEIVGIGTALRIDKQARTPRIVQVLPNSPANQAGGHSGLLIAKIDDAITEGMGLEECVGLIQGPVGSIVRLELIDLESNATNTIVLARQKVQHQP